MGAVGLSDEDKRVFLRDGYVVVRNAVPDEISQRAHDVVRSHLPEHERHLLVPPALATHDAVLALFNGTCLADILGNEMGPFPDVISSQVAVTPAYDRLDGRVGAHVDGSWSGEIPASADEIDPVRGRPLDPTRYFGAHDERRGSNDGQLWQDPDRTVSLGSYTALVGVALNDQLVPGNGQFGVLRGMHETVEASFRMQRDAGGPVGPEGPGWPRIAVTDAGRTYLNGLPQMVRDRLSTLRDGREPNKEWPWPELTPVLLRRGDAVIALHSCPHTATPNLGPNPRMNVYFRIRRLREGNPNEGSRRVGHGVSDHPDRGYFGQFLDYPDGYDPWRISVEKLCDHWSEWDGMRDIVEPSRTPH